MLLSRLILVLVGFLLLRWLLRMPGVKRRPQEPGAQVRPPTPPPAPFSEGEIRDAEFEDMDQRREAGRGGR